MIAIYLTRGGKVFIVPQYAIPAPGSETEWSCPDFVALDFDKHEVVVVEVATGDRIGRLLGNVRNRETQWFEPLRAKLQGDGIASDWPVRFLGFVRKYNLVKAQKEFAGAEDVTFVAIEDATFSWDYWEDRKRGLPPRNAAQNTAR